MAFVVGGYGCTGTGGCRGLAVRGRRHRHVGVMHRSRMQQRAEVETGKEVDVAVEKEGQVSPTEMLIAALEEFGKRGETGMLRALLRADCKWENPMSMTSGMEEILSVLSSSWSWSVSPSFYIAETSPEQSRFDWVASATWPYPHRPRVVLAGSSEVEADSDGKIYRVKDDWFIRPREAIMQAIPRWEDIYWVYAAPHCETLAGLRRVLKRADGYDIVEESAREDFETVVDIDNNDEVDAPDEYYAIPKPPEDVFNGKVRKQEIYSPTRPTCLQRRADGQLLWSTPYPTKYWRSERHKDMSDQVVIQSIPRRKLAVHYIYGFPQEDDFGAAIQTLETSLLRDGRISSPIAREDILYRNYACKNGFDSRGLLTITSYYGLPFSPRCQEIAVILNDQDPVTDINATLPPSPSE